jgi:hypothetical protein
MGIPRKASRGIEINGRTYRWMARLDKLDPSKSILTVQEDVDRPGKPKQFTVYGTVTPSDVTRIVQGAIKSGWDPTSR